MEEELMLREKLKVQPRIVSLHKKEIPKEEQKIPHIIYIEDGHKVIYTDQGNRLILGTRNENMILAEIEYFARHPEIYAQLYAHLLKNNREMTAIKAADNLPVTKEADNLLQENKIIENRVQRNKNMAVDKMKISDFIPIVGFLRYSKKLDQDGLSDNDFDRIGNRYDGFLLYNLLLLSQTTVLTYEGLEQLL